ncbi:MAG TPA: NAD(P)-dependent alcohol dehydrogenase [Novosphingobium sp.]
MPRNIRAAVTRQGGRTGIETVTIGDPQPDEVLVELVATGICHTDIVMRDGLLPVPKPVVLGHEGAGRVLAIGSAVSDLHPGDPVVLSFASCGRCRSCADDQPAYCHDFFPSNFLAARPDGTTALSNADGPVHSHVFGQSSFATHAIVPARNAVRVPDDVPLELLGPLGCGFLTGAGAVWNALSVRRGDSIAILGAGAVGLAAIMAARISGATRIVAVDRSHERVCLAQELGATEAHVANENDLAGFGITDLDHALDTTGHAPLIEQAIALLAPRGQMGLLAAFAPDTTIRFDGAHLMSAGRVVRGIVEGSSNPIEIIPKMLEHWRAGRFPIEKLIEFFPFDRIEEAIAAAESGQAIKPVLRMQ